MTVDIKDVGARKRLFDAAARVFAEKGFNKATVDEIAEAAEVAKGTVYYYFKGKEELFLFLMEEGMETLRRQIENAMCNENVEDSIVKMIDAHIEFFKEYRDLCIILLSEAWGISSRQERLQEMLDKYYSSVNRVIDRGIHEKIIRPVSKEVLCASLFGTTAMVAQHFLRKKEEFSWSDLKEQVREVLLNGFRV